MQCIRDDVVLCVHVCVSGHMEALRLITSNKFSEKNTGYMTCAILWNENTEFLRLLVQSVRKDLMPVNEIFQCLALSFVANIGGNEFAEGLAQDVRQLLVSGKSRSFVRKKARWHCSDCSARIRVHSSARGQFSRSIVEFVG